MDDLDMNWPEQMTEEQIQEIEAREAADEEMEAYYAKFPPKTDLEDYEDDIAQDLREEGARVVGNCVAQPQMPHSGREDGSFGRVQG